MTKLRSALSHHRALTVIVEQLGFSRAVAVTGRRERSIRKWSEPDVEPGVPLQAALALDLAYIEATGAAVAPFEAWYTLQLQLARAKAAAAASTEAERLARAHREVGEAFAATVMASCPGADPRARRQADLEIDEAIIALAMTRSSCTEQAEAL